MLPKSIMLQSEREKPKLKIVTEDYHARPKCLIVDDLPQNNFAMKALLKDEDVEVHSAGSANEALELMLKHEYAFSLLDVHMPDMNGFELAEIMRGSEKTKATPIIFVTAAPADIYRVFKGYEAGAIDFLQKPLYPKIVQGKVRIFLELYYQKRELQQRTQALMLANEEIKAFSYTVSHDLRSPLRSMEGFSRLVLEMYGEKLDEQGRDYLFRIHESSKKMELLINGMLNLANIGNMVMKRTPVNMSELARKIIDDFINLEKERQVEIVLEQNLLLDADLTLCTALLQNLIGNAWKYTSKTAGPKIEFGMTDYKNKRVFYLRDNGVGFNQNCYYKLFEPFQRLHDQKEYPGIGIGLATVKKIVERHNGEIWAESEILQGTTFYFTLSV
jgi:two-component system sensor histidine kinase/response regulator